MSWDDAVNAGIQAGNNRAAPVTEKEQAAVADQHRRAARTVADRAVDADECRDLLEMLGIAVHTQRGQRT